MLEPFDGHIERVDLHALVDVRELDEALGPLAAPKDEFETTAEYEGRIARLRAQTRVSDHALADTFAVVASVNAYYFHYDADGQTVRVEHVLGISTLPYGMIYPSGEAPPHSAYEDPVDHDAHVLELHREDREGNSYEAANAYGRQVTVEVVHVTEHNLALMNVLGNINCAGQHVTFQALQSAARDLREHLAAVVRFVLRRPYAVESTFHVDPEVSHPTEIFMTEHNVIGRAVEVYLIDGRTGRVIQAYRPR